MSRTYSSAKNNKRKTSKVHFQQYLYNANVPISDDYGFSRAELDAEQLEDGFGMKRQVRQIAQRLRSRSA